jgi:hypothetical protein
MAMAEHSIIMGTVEGISRREFLELEAELKAAFDTVQWKDGTVLIRSQRFHDRVRALFQKIADAVEEGRYGSLLYIGNGRVAAIYFGSKKFKAIEYKEPEPPDWWGR